MTVEQLVKILKYDLDSLVEPRKSDIDGLKDQLKKLAEVSSNFDKNWVGQWASRTYNYYNDFVSGDGQVELDQDTILKYVEKQAGIKLDNAKTLTHQISKDYRDFQGKVVTELSVIKGKENFEPEIELLDKIEKQEWGITPQFFRVCRKALRQATRKL